MVSKLRPLLMGGVMGLALVYTIHTGQSTPGIAALALLVGADILVILVVLAATYWSARLSPSLRGRLDRLHRPTLLDLCAMAAGAAVVTLAMHLFLNGGI